MHSDLVGDPASAQPATGSISDAEALSIQGVSKRFGATQALDDVGLTLEYGRVRALLGGNGSGKSTLVKVLAGAHSADEGTICRGGNVWQAGEYDAASARSIGLRFVHQTLALFPTLTVAENMALARGYPTRRGRRVDWPRVCVEAEELLDRYGLASLAMTPVAELRPAQQALVAIASAVVDDSSTTGDVIVIDEATAALPRGEAYDLIKSLRSLADGGHAIMFISHRIDEVLEVADDITVLRDGRVVESCEREGLDHARLVELLSGGAGSRATKKSVLVDQSTRRLQVKGLRSGVLESVELDVADGEILGISGLLGSGRSTLLHSIFDPGRRAGGTVTVNGSQVLGTPADAMDAGVALVPEDRARQAVFDQRTVADNLTEAISGRFWRRGWLSIRRANGAGRQMIKRHGIVTHSELTPIGSLSGGNQQKVVLARWLARKPVVLLLDEPTQGVDIHARDAVHNAVREAVSDGACAVLASSDLDELMEISDRIVVLVNGRIVAELQAPFDPDQLLALEQTSTELSSVSAPE